MIRVSDSSGVRIVPPRDRQSIRKDTYRLREIMRLNDSVYFPIMFFLEHVMPIAVPDFYVEPVDDSILVGRMAETVPEQHLIRVRQSVYDAACNGHPWARKIMAHELGHYIYHDAEHIAYAYPHIGEQIPKQFSPEYQADVFAAELLAPVNLIRGMNCHAVAQKCGIPVSSARGQLNQAAHTKEGRKKKKAARHKSPAARQ